MAQIKRAQAGGVLDRLLASTPTPPEQEPQEPTEAPVEVTSGDDAG